VLGRVVLDLQKTAKDGQQQIPMLKKVTHVFVDVSIAKIGAYCIDFTV
jgi:competence protein ComGF